MDRGTSGLRLTRREWLRYTMAAGAATTLAGRMAWAATCTDQTPIPIHLVENTGCGIREEMPLSPLILQPWQQELPIPQAMRPGWRRPDGTLVDSYSSEAWACRRAYDGSSRVTPGSEQGHQDCYGHRPTGTNLPYAGTHQLWPGTAGKPCADYPNPLYYHIRIQVSQHRVTNSVVRPIGRTSSGIVTTGSDKNLPYSTIYGYNGAFASQMINAEYGRPVCLRFENDLDYNPLCLDRQNFGAPDWAFLTHLHNGHTAPESDGNPNHLTENEGGYVPGDWCDNLYMLYPAGGDDREKQSFLWFHDHRMHHTGANVYKGMLGLMPHYDPKIDNGDERTGLRLPGVRRDNGDGSFNVDYDIPLALYDCALDDGIVRHRDQHIPKSGGLCDKSHPEWWGKSFFRHMPNHGFVGDIFTVNGVAFPVLYVKRRNYRLRFLGASIARCYDLSLMRGQVAPWAGQQGQWNFVTNGTGGLARTKGQQCMRMTQIASEGGLLPTPIIRDSIQIWPAKRREFVVDFGKYMDGSSTNIGDEIYLANTLLMPDGRKPVFAGEGGYDENYCVPMMKIVIVGDAEDNSVMPVPGQTLRPMPPYLPAVVRQRASFLLTRGGVGDEGQWVINGLEFDPTRPLHKVKLNSAEEWTVQNGGGGWTHPMHIHQEEHRVLSRQSSTNAHPEDTGKEDVIALDPGETVKIYRKFRTFAGKYVAHCHNLAHEDHNMMFGWVIEP